MDKIEVKVWLCSYKDLLLFKGQKQGFISNFLEYIYDFSGNSDFSEFISTFFDFKISEYI